MYDYLYEYLVLHRKLAVPGIGNIILEKKSAQTDFTQRIIKPPVYTISLQPGTESPSKRFFQWLADRLGIAYHEAIGRFNGFVHDMKATVAAGGKVRWPEVGVFSKNLSGDIRLEAAITEHEYDRPVTAVRVIRDKAVHQVRVGEDEKTSAEMTVLLNPDEIRRSYRKYAGVVLLSLAVITLVIYFVQNGCNSQSAANQQKVEPKKAAVTHRQIN